MTDIHKRCPTSESVVITVSPHIVMWLWLGFALSYFNIDQYKMDIVCYHDGTPDGQTACQKMKDASQGQWSDQNRIGSVVIASPEDVGQSLQNLKSYFVSVQVRGKMTGQAKDFFNLDSLSQKNVVLEFYSNPAPTSAAKVIRSRLKMLEKLEEANGKNGARLSLKDLLARKYAKRTLEWDRGLVYVQASSMSANIDCLFLYRMDVAVTSASASSIPASAVVLTNSQLPTVSGENAGAGVFVGHYFLGDTTSWGLALKGNSWVNFNLLGVLLTQVVSERLQDVTFQPNSWDILIRKTQRGFSPIPC